MNVHSFAYHQPTDDYRGHQDYRADMVPDVVVADDDDAVLLYKPKRKTKQVSKKMSKKKKTHKSAKKNTMHSSVANIACEQDTRELKHHTLQPEPQYYDGNQGRDLEYGNDVLEVFRRPSVDDYLDNSSDETARSEGTLLNIFPRDPEEQATEPEREGASTQNISFLHHFNHRMRDFMKDMMRFRALKLSQLLLSVYIAVLTFADIGPPGGLRDPETGYVVDQTSAARTMNGLVLVNGTERSIVATSTFQVACIGIARLSAWFMYPALVFVFISKFRATMAFLSKSPLAMHMYHDSHELHVYCGWTIVICASIHTTFHLARWAAQGNMHLLIDHFSGLSGLIIILSCLLICIPMTIFREQIKYEVRKKLHYLFIVFALALVFHTPKSAVPNGGFTAYVFGTLLVWYFLDATYCYFFMTEKIDTTKFSVVPTGVRMTMTVSERFQKAGAQGGICYVCLPWIAKEQWHAFSLFENPSNPAERQIFIQKCGDWTTKLHRHLQRDTSRPAWVHGPFPSPYDNAVAYDNQILVASGIGITPALSVIRAHKHSRQINLIWAVRDPHLLEFFLRHLYLDHEGWNLIFYTGKEKLRIPQMDHGSNSNICIIEGRPKLGEVIPNIIYGIESGLGIPENYTPQTKSVVSEMLADRLLDIKSTRSHRLDETVQDLACYASELGFHLPSEEVSQDFDLFTSKDAGMGRRRTLQKLQSHLSMGFRPWDHHEGSQKYVKNLDPKLILPTWGILYCGGAKVVLAELERISDEYDIGLHVESFAW